MKKLIDMMVSVVTLIFLSLLTAVLVGMMYFVLVVLGII